MLRYQLSLLIGLAVAGASVSGSPHIQSRFAACGGEQITGAQEDVTTAETPQQKMDRAMKILAQLEPSLDAQTRQNLPAIKATLQHWADGEELGPVELDVVSSLGLGGRGDEKIDFSAMKKKLLASTDNMVKQSAKFQFEARESELRGGRRGVVNLQVEGRETPIVTFFTPTSQYSATKRAHVVAERMKALSQSHPTWWTELVLSRTGGKTPLNFIAVKRSEDKPLVTTDSTWAREAGCTPEQLAKQVINSIHAVIADSTRAWENPTTPEQKRWSAYVSVQNADKAFDEHNLDQAKTLYMQAIKTDPNYVTPYLGLAEVYLKQSHLSAAREQLRIADKLPGLSDEDRKDIQKMRALVK